jgi:transcriptional regulator with XRE-family HTH domain
MTPVQVRMARAALGMTAEALSKEAGLSPDDVMRLESGGQDGIASARLRATLESAGVVFLDADGVRYDEGRTAAKTVPLEAMNSYNDE